MTYPIIDLHCDLLGCVAEASLTFESPETCCSVPQLIQGGVTLQTLAIATITRKGASAFAEKQVDLYKKLLAEYPDTIAPFASYRVDSKRVHTIFAVENASGLADEDEPLERAFERLEHFRAVEEILYISLTWNDENRFGGGNASSVGLKEDGKALLSSLDKTGIAIDLSHTSDALARDILEYIDRHRLDITPIASHSNYREVTDVKRNLPDDIAKEIIKRGGLIGLNFVRRFVGDAPYDFIKHIEHGLALGGGDAICLGADFYGGINVPIPDISFPTFQESFNNSSCYLDFIGLLTAHLPEEVVAKIAYQNAHSFCVELVHS